MPKKITFNDILQNKIKDFVGTKRWSNSQFASRYSDTYAEVYGKMEAPSTSTSRKLIEEKGHEYAEKECIILEKLTSITFYKMWLEEQKRIILKKMDDYSLAHGQEVRNHEKTFDTEIQFGNLVRKYTHSAGSLSIDSLTVCFDRYVNVETKMPLVVLCDTAAFASYLVEESIDDVLYVEPDKLLEDGADYPNNVVYTSLKASPMSKEAGRCVNDALKLIYGSAAIGKTKHVIVIIESWDKDAIDKSLEAWNESVLLLRFHWTYQLMNGWIRMEDDAGRMHPMLKRFVSDTFNEVKTIKDPCGNAHHRPSFDDLYNIHSLTCMNLDKDEDALLTELIKNDLHTYGITRYIVSRVYKTDDKKAIGRILNELERKAVSPRPSIPEATRKHITKCLGGVNTLPEAFKDEILCWIAQGGSPVMPDCDGPKEWMEFILNQYDKQQEWLDDEAYLSALNILKTDGFPMYWFSENCDQKSLLTAIITYPEWKEASHNGEDIELPQLQFILLDGATPSLDAKGWKRWFERNYNLNSVTSNFDLMIQIRQLKLKMGRLF